MHIDNVQLNIRSKLSTDWYALEDRNNNIKNEKLELRKIKEHAQEYRTNHSIQRASAMAINKKDKVVNSIKNSNKIESII